VCAARVTAAPAATRDQTLRLVGTGGSSPTHRPTPDRSVAGIWFPCTLSLTKHLGERLGGPRGVVALFPAARDGTWEREVERATGVPAPELRRRWLERLRLTER
jgi:hypothetical protein